MANNYGLFTIELPQNLQEKSVDDLEHPLSDSDTELLLDMVLEHVNACEEEELKEVISESISAAGACASSTENQAEMKKELSVHDDIGRPEIPSSSSGGPGRFRKVSKEEMDKYDSMNQSKSTKMNTKWGMNIYQDWHVETFESKMDMMTTSKEELAEKLGRFYCEARPKQGSKSSDTTEYHRNTLKNIRAAINRHLQDLDRDIDIVNSKDFKKANKLLDGMLKERMATGQSKATKHKEIIELGDLSKISKYFERAECSPLILKQCVWYNIAIHFVTRGLECHHQLSQESFEFKTDESGLEYAVMTHETRQNNFQGGLTNTEATYDKRMYATGEANCPIKMLKLLIQKTHPNSTSLFNQCVKEALCTSEEYTVWYNCKVLGKSSFSYMPDISKYANCSKRYTAHCLRATVIQNMSDAGYATRQIMFMSGHRNEASVRSYTRNCSSDQKRCISKTLSAVASGSDSSCSGQEIIPMVVQSVPCPTPTAQKSQMGQIQNTANHACIQSVQNLPEVQPNNQLIQSNSQLPHQLVSSYQDTSGFLTNSTFNNCSFTFNKL